ncbi:MAG: T9SS type A sorting domain-containing protein [Saprospiraceae bacterium]
MDSKITLIYLYAARSLSCLRSLNEDKFVPCGATRAIILMAVILSGFNFRIAAQAGHPCNAHRWEKGAHWTGVGCGVNDGNNAPNPLGIVRCANAADTESGIDDNTTYVSAVFQIVPNNCINPNTFLPTMVDPPFEGQKIAWFNFDVRPFAGTYEFQTIATGNYELEWALYYSTAETCNTGANGLSGNCNQLSGLLACGTDFNGWAPQPFVTPFFDLPTNLYLAVWKKDATDSSNDDFDFTFKARYGCGDACGLFADGAPKITCNPDGSYTVVQNLFGTNTTVSVTAPGSSSIVTDPNPLTFTTADAIPNVNTGSVTVTYPAGVNYDVTFTPSGTGSFCNPVHISGTAPNCCTPPPCSIDGLGTVCPGTSNQHCGPVGQSGYSWAVSAGGTINGASNQQCVTIIASSLCNTSYTVTLTVGTGSCTSTCTKTVTVVDNTAPVITCPSVTSPIECPAGPSFGVATATDACDASPTITFSDATTPGNCPQEYSVKRTWTATDDCGNTSTCSRTITVEDNTAPVITCPSVTSPIECPASPNFGVATATDVCDGSPTITFSDTTTSGNCPQEYSVKRTWAATDDCGNISTCSRTISIEDNTAPVITCPSVTSPIECPASPNFGVATATDVCDSSPTITFGDLTTPGDCPQAYSVTRTWTATDDCGNTSTCSSTITVEDNTPPVIICPTVTSPVECSGNPGFGDATATDDCDAFPTITFTNDTFPEACPQVYTVLRIWKATDDCGNASNCSQTITFEDNTPPVITCPADKNLFCGDITLPSNTGFATATDVCDNNVGITYSDNPPSGPTCGGSGGVFVRTWLATDDCGNTATCTQTITCGPCIEICALTQGFYGSTNGKFNHNGVDRTALELIKIALAAPSGPMVLGFPAAGGGGSLTITVASADCLNSLLPGGGPPKKLPGDWVLNGPCNLPDDWKKNERFASVLWGQAVTLWLNSKLFPEFCALDLANACVDKPSFIPASVNTVCNLLDYTSGVLGEIPALTNGQLGQLAGYLGDIHDRFDECQSACAIYQDPPPGDNNGLNEEPEDNHVAATDYTVLPNPLSDVFTVILDKQCVHKKVSIVVFNQLGQLVLTNDFTSLPLEYVQLSAADLCAGIYQIHVRVNNQRPVSKTIVVIKP